MEAHIFEQPLQSKLASRTKLFSSTTSTLRRARFLPSPLHRTAFVPSTHPRILHTAFFSRSSTARLPSYLASVRPPPARIQSPRPCPTQTPCASFSESQNLADVSEPVLRAVESSRQLRKTVADIAARSGLSMADTATQAAKLAALTKAPIDVTDAGELAYRFPSNVRVLLRAASLRAQIRMAWEKAFPPLYSAARLAFGALLILSIAVTFVAIAVLSSAANSSDDDRRGSRSSFMPVRFFAPNMFDIIWYSRAASYQRREKRSDQMSFLEAVYSFVFGDGDPNTEFDSRRYRAIAAIIRANKGSLTAEQLAPYLDPTFQNGNFVDESFVLPVLQRFNGQPEVTENGDIIYVFPDFLRTGGSGVEFVGSSKPLQEELLSMTRATGGQRALVVALGAVNVLGVVTLGAKLATAVAVTPDAAAFLGLIKTIYPALATYAASFVLVPFIRWIRQRRVNAAITKRNNARRLAANRLARPDLNLRRKMQAAENLSLKDSSTIGKIIYSSDKDLIDQSTVQQEISDDFDRRLNG